MLLFESPFEPQGGLGVHVLSIASRLCEHVDLTLMGIGKDQYQRLLIVEDGVPREVSEPEWRAGAPTGSYRLLHIRNLNEHNMDLVKGMAHEVVKFENFVCNWAHFFAHEHFDLVHMHETHLLPVAKVACLAHRAHLVVTSHLSHTSVHPDSLPNYEWGCETELHAYHTANRVIAVSPSYRKMLEETFLVPPEKIRVIPNGVDWEAFAAVKPERRESDRPLAAFVGRLVPSKGLQLVVDAAKELPEWDFLIQAAISPSLEEMVPIMDGLIAATPNVTWSREEDFGLPKWARLKSATVGLVPSLHEPFGIVALEWMAASVPLITTGVGGLGSFCNDTNAVIIEPTVGGLVSALRAWMPDQSRVDRALETAKRYSWDSPAAQTLEVYEACLRKSGSSTRPSTRSGREASTPASHSLI